MGVRSKATSSRTGLNASGCSLKLTSLFEKGIAMTTMTLSAKRQVVLPAELCRQVSLAPGARVRVELAPDGCGIVIQPACDAPKKPVSVLLGRVKHQGKPVAIEEMQGMSVMRALAQAGDL